MNKASEIESSGRNHSKNSNTSAPAEQVKAREKAIERETYRLTMLRVIELGKETEFMETLFDGGGVTIDPNGDLICITKPQLDGLFDAPAEPQGIRSNAERLHEAAQQLAVTDAHITHENIVAQVTDNAMREVADLTAKLATVERERDAMRGLLEDATHIVGVGWSMHLDEDYDEPTWDGSCIYGNVATQNNPMAVWSEIRDLYNERSD